MSSRTILLAGAFGHGNVGDDAIAVAECRLLREIDPSVRIVVLGGEPSRLRQTIGEEGHHLSWRSPLRAASLIGLVRRADAVLIGGGGLLSDRLHFYRPYFLLALAAEALGKPVMFYAVGAYPPSTRLYPLLARAVLNRATAVTVRDEFSLRSIATLGARRKVTLTADPAISLAGPARAPNLVRGNSGPLIGISLRPLYHLHSSESDATRLAELLARCLDGVVDATRGKLMLIPMHFGGPDDDGLFDDLVVRQMTRPAIVEMAAKQRPQDVLAGIARCDVVLGMRLHANILAAAAGVPSIALAHDPKIREFMRELGCEDRVLDIHDLEPANVAARIVALLDERERASAEIRRRVETLTASAQACALTAVRLAGCPGEAADAQRVALEARS